MNEVEYAKFEKSIWKDTQIKGNEKYILIYLISYHNKKLGYSFPTYEQIQEGTGISRNTVAKLLKSLENKGYITRDKYKTKGGWNNIYYIHKYLVVNNKNLSELQTDDTDNQSTNSLSNKSESLIEPTTNELLLSKSDKFDKKLTAEQRTQLNQLDTDRLMKAIEKAEQNGKYKTYTFGYLIAIYNKPVEPKTEAPKKVVENKTIKTRYHNSFNEHYKNYDYDELEHKLLQMQERRRKGLA